MKRTLMALLALAFLAACSSSTPAVAEVTGDQWQEKRFGKELYKADGSKVSVDTLKNKVIGVYFSAHWCPPCRAFTPKLVQFHKDVAKDGFEIVFASADHTTKKMYEYMKETGMPWLALEFRGEKFNELSQDLGVRGIPYLVIFDKDGKLITTDGRSDVTELGKEALKKWKK